MISLSGLSAVPAGYQAGQTNLLALAQKQMEQDAQTAYGQALAALAQGQGIPTAPQMPTTRTGLAAPPVSKPGPDFNSSFFNGQTSNTPEVSALTAALQAKGLAAGTQATPRPAPPAAQVPAATAPTQAAQPQVKLPPVAGVQPGTLTWPAVVNAIKAANPKISPAALAGAVDKFVPLMQDEEAQKWKQIAAQQDQQRINQTAATAAQGSADDVGGIVDSIISGDFPPPGATGSSRSYTPSLNGKISQELAKRGFNLAAHIADWNAQQKLISAQNSPVAVRFIGAIDSADAFLGKFKQNVDAWNAGGFPTIVNQTVLDQAVKGQLPTTDPQGAQKQAALLTSQYRDLISILASVFSSGGVPTDSARRLAQEQIDLGWSAGTIDSVIDQISGLLDDRKNALRGVQAYTPGNGTTNAYGNPQPALSPAVPEGQTATGSDGKQYVWKGGAWQPQ